MALPGESRLRSRKPLPGEVRSRKTRSRFSPSGSNFRSMLRKCGSMMVHLARASRYVNYLWFESYFYAIRILGLQLVLNWENAMSANYLRSPCFGPIQCVGNLIPSPLHFSSAHLHTADWGCRHSWASHYFLQDIKCLRERKESSYQSDTRLHSIPAWSFKHKVMVGWTLLEI